MRVLHLVPSVDPSGGMGAVAVALTSHQRVAGIDSSIWCVDPPLLAAASGIHIVPLPVIGPTRFAYSRVGERRARTTHVDVVHQHGLWTAQSRITQAFRERDIPTIVAPHGCLEPYGRQRSAWKKRVVLAWFESTNLRLASCLYATSEQELRTFRDFQLRAPVAVVPNGVASAWLHARGDAARFRHRHDLPGQRRVMLFLSRIHPKKGLPLLIEALASHRDRLRDWCLVIAGPDTDGHRAEIERLAERLDVAREIRFVGPVFGDDKLDAFAASELFVLPTHSENFGLVIAEALASGVPVITTHGAPWPDLAADDCGWWVPVDSASIGAALVDAAVRSAEELQGMGARGRTIVAARFLWPAVATRTIELYRWLRGEVERPAFVVVD